MIIVSLQLFGSSWQLEKEKNGVLVYTREVEGSDFLEFKGVVEVDASVDAVIAFLYDIPITPEWIDDCDFAMTLEEVAFHDNYIYQTFDLPFPVSDRELILHSTLTYTKEGATLASVAASDFCQNYNGLRCKVVNDNKKVVITKSKGIYTMTALGVNRTKIVWKLHTEPGGSIPTWLANAMVVDLPFYSLSKLREMVLLPQYHEMTKAALQKAWQKQYNQYH